MSRLGWVGLGWNRLFIVVIQAVVVLIAVPAVTTSHLYEAHVRAVVGAVDGYLRHSLYPRLIQRRERDKKRNETGPTKLKRKQREPNETETTQKPKGLGRHGPKRNETGRKKTNKNETKQHKIDRNGQTKTKRPTRGRQQQQQQRHLASIR